MVVDVVVVVVMVVAAVVVVVGWSPSWLSSSPASSSSSSLLSLLLLLAVVVVVAAVVCGRHSQRGASTRSSEICWGTNAVPVHAKQHATTLAGFHPRKKSGLCPSSSQPPLIFDRRGSTHSRKKKKKGLFFVTVVATTTGTARKTLSEKNAPPSQPAHHLGGVALKGILERRALRAREVPAELVAVLHGQLALLAVLLGHQVTRTRAPSTPAHTEAEV